MLRTAHQGDAEVAVVAYSPERERYRRDLTRALLRVAVVAFAAGFALLLLFV